jgi:hypothetical protein
MRRRLTSDLETQVGRISTPNAWWDAEAVMQRTQEAQMATKLTRELDFRSSDGLDVALLWDPETDRLKVTVFDGRSGDDFELEVSSNEAMDAFHHPYAYAANSGVHFLAGTRLQSDPVYA